VTGVSFAHEFKMGALKTCHKMLDDHGLIDISHFSHTASCDIGIVMKVMQFRLVWNENLLSSQTILCTQRGVGYLHDFTRSPLLDHWHS